MGYCNFYNLDAIYLLRWRFEYNDGKPPKTGMWLQSHDNDPATQAWCQNKTNLSRAIIEGKHVATRQVVTLAECDGVDFCNFQWRAATMAPASVTGIKAVTLVGEVIGLELASRDFVIQVLIDGKTTVIARKEEDKSFHYAGYGS